MDLASQERWVFLHPKPIEGSRGQCHEASSRSTEGGEAEVEVEQNQDQPGPTYDKWSYTPIILLMEKILHQSIGSLSHYLQVFHTSHMILRFVKGKKRSRR